MKRKTIRTADSRKERDNQEVRLGGAGREITRTDIGGERYHPGEDEETG